MSLTETTECTEMKAEKREDNVGFVFLAKQKKQNRRLLSVNSVLSVRAFCSAFTLVELMIVIGIIAILVAMMFPVVLGAKAKARKKQALTEAHNIALALKAYRMEYGKWPNQNQAVADTTYFVSNYLVIRELAGDNPRGRVFLAIQATNQTDSVTNYVDPWGVPYVIAFDEDVDGNTLIAISNITYGNNFVSSMTDRNYLAGPATSGIYIVYNKDLAVASFAGETNVEAFEVETWSDPQ